MYLVTVLVTALLVLVSSVFSQISGDYTLKILHVNDVHARFEQTSIYSGRCTPQDASANKCYGGFPRLQTEISRLKRGHANTLFLSGGDYYQGTVWYTVHKWRVMAHFLNLLDHDAMAIGNHEFDDGMVGLAPFLANVTFPILAANIDTSLEPSIDGKIKPSVVLTLGGRKIGIVGYITVETKVPVLIGQDHLDTTGNILLTIFMVASTFPMTLRTILTLEV